MTLPKAIVNLSFFQLAVLLFFPVLSLGERNIFLSDLVFFLLMGLTFAELYLTKRLKQKGLLFGGLALFLVVWGHGAFRPLVEQELGRQMHYHMHEPDRFKPFRELVVAFRFYSWFAFGILFSQFFKNNTKTLRTYLQTQGKNLAYAMMLISSFILCSRFSSEFHQMLGGLYHFDPTYEFWRGRMYGTFQSPVEAGCALSLGFLFLWILFNNTKNLLFGGALVFLSPAIILTKTATPFFGMFLVGAVFLVFRKKRKLVALGVLVASLLIFIALATTSVEVRQKAGDLLYRTWMWRVLLFEAAKRFDLLVFGFGFATYHIDSSYLFLINRGGLALFGGFAYVLTKVLKTTWKKWSWSQKIIALYVLLLCLPLDVLIYRHFIGLFLLIGVPLLSGKEVFEKARSFHVDIF
ncbi:MAG: hypothetical protein AB7F43_03865 [Bacteriovoracia bacterium]